MPAHLRVCQTKPVSRFRIGRPAVLKYPLESCHSWLRWRWRISITRFNLDLHVVVTSRGGPLLTMGHER